MLMFDILHYPLPFFSGRGKGSQITAIVVHCVGIPTLEKVFNAFKAERISAHFLVPTLTGSELKKALPTIFFDRSLKFPDQIPVIQLVDPLQTAWHAGKSQFAHFNQQVYCETSLNPCSIGIEFHAPGYANGDGSDLYHFVRYSEKQKQTGIALIDFIMKTYHIPTRNLLAHSTISVGRKTDPGPYFFWQDLYEAGFGYVPSHDLNRAKIRLSTCDLTLIKKIQKKLNQIGFYCPVHGYLDKTTLSIMDAYTLQFAPDLWNGPYQNINEALIHSLDKSDEAIFF